MKNLGCTYIVIPSLGRDSINQICEDIFSDSHGFKVQIILIADGKDAENRINNILKKDKRITIQKNRFKSGVVGALNTGLELVPSGGQLMFFSDDDVWVPGKINRSIKKFQELKKSCLIFQIKAESMFGKSVIKPEYIPTAPIQPLQYLFSKPQYIKNRRYVSLTTFIGPSEIAKIKFREDLDFREDIEWLNRVSNSGVPIFLAKGVNAEVEIGYARTVVRESVEQLVKFSSILNAESQNLEAKYLGWFFLRPYVMTGQVCYGIRVMIRSGKLKKIIFRKEILGILMYITLGTLMKIRIWALR